MLKKYGFYCKEYGWTKDYCNPNGKGYDNEFKEDVIKSDSVVFDNASGLMWQQSGANTTMNFEDAKEWVEQVNFAGFNDWRLPTLEEAMSMVEPEQKNGYYINPIFDNKQGLIWTADEMKSDPRTAWAVGFGKGDCGKNSFNVYIFVRAVRSAQPSDTYLRD